jgi:hypothetical protein
MMADLAQVFHWPLSELKSLSLGELSIWHAEAVLRNPSKEE